RAKVTFPLGALGALAGAGLLLVLDREILKPLVLALLVAAGAFIAVRRPGNTPPGPPPARPLLWAGLIAVAIGAYDGFFGPGTGTFFALALARWCRHDLLGATGRAKLLNLATNFAALAVFLCSGRLHIALGLAMAAASAAGHWVGAHLGLRHSGRVIRPAVALVCAGLFLKLLSDALAQ
ncbi:MAG: TSUP family transporter, partial [Elusimicrobia bacterium]|nr:TSUP family transporter [Elusimicrobiota bacterium]